MSEKVKETLKSTAPWREGVQWWVVLAEGIVALLLGLYFTWQSAEASILLAELVALFLLVGGLLQTLAGFGKRAAGAAPSLAFIRGIIGLATGALLFFLMLLDALTFEVGIVILASGTLVYGLLGLIVAFLNRQQGVRWGTIINSALFLVIGILLFLSRAQEAYISQWLAPLLIIFGGALVLYGYTLYRRQRDETPPAAVADSGQPESSPDQAQASEAGTGQADGEENSSGT